MKSTVHRIMYVGRGNEIKTGMVFSEDLSGTMLRLTKEPLSPEHEANVHGVLVSPMRITVPSG